MYTKTGNFLILAPITVIFMFEHNFLRYQTFSRPVLLLQQYFKDWFAMRVIRDIDNLAKSPCTRIKVCLE